MSRCLHLRTPPHTQNWKQFFFRLHPTTIYHNYTSIHERTDKWFVRKVMTDCLLALLDLVGSRTKFDGDRWMWMREDNVRDNNEGYVPRSLRHRYERLRLHKRVSTARIKSFWMSWTTLHPTFSCQQDNHLVTSGSCWILMLLLFNPGTSQGVIYSTTGHPSPYIKQNDIYKIRHIKCKDTTYRMDRDPIVFCVVIIELENIIGLLNFTRLNIWYVSVLYDGE